MESVGKLRMANDWVVAYFVILMCPREAVQKDDKCQNSDDRRLRKEENGIIEEGIKTYTMDEGTNQRKK